MAGDSSKPSIPAWQRPQPAPVPETDRELGKASGAEESTVAEDEKPAVGETDEVGDVDDSSLPPDTSKSQLDMVEAFLSDPQVKDEPIQKKRAFLESKEIPVETIDQVLDPKQPSTTAFEAGDFAAFRQRQPIESRPPTQSSAPAQTASAPPIITYPEFLVEAHKPAPLITPTRVLNATYLTAGLATLFYGASTFLIQPMIANLTEARHDFAGHSHSKLDEFNTRLRQIVSKVPDSKPALFSDMESEVDEEDSTVSDPTELFHRDMGTQTTELDFLTHSTSSQEPPKKDTVTYQSNGLSILTSHLNEIIDDTPTQEEANNDRQEAMTKLRHHLDMMLYANPGAPLWEQTDEGLKQGKAKGGDKVEELKKEIRGVKGVFLSARRFPGAGSVGRLGVGS